MIRRHVQSNPCQAGGRIFCRPLFFYDSQAAVSHSAVPGHADMKPRPYVIRTPSDETPCPQCRWELLIGDTAYQTDTARGFCSKGCAEDHTTNVTEAESAGRMES